MSKLIILPVGEDAFANTEAAGEFGDPARVCCDWDILDGLREGEWDTIALLGLVAEWPAEVFELLFGPFSSSYSSSLNHISSSSSSWRGSLLKRPGRSIELTLYKVRDISFTYVIISKRYSKNFGLHLYERKVLTFQVVQPAYLFVDLVAGHISVSRL